MLRASFAVLTLAMIAAVAGGRFTLSAAEAGANGGRFPGAILLDAVAPTLTLSGPLMPMLEGQPTPHTVGISQPLDVALTVRLSTSDEKFTVPSSVTIPAGETSVTFDATAIDNQLRDGSRRYVIMGDADLFNSASWAVLVRDNDVARYTLAPNLADIVNVSEPVSVQVTALDIEDNPINGVFAVADLLIVLPDGTTRAASPSRVEFTGPPHSSAPVTVPPDARGPLRFRAVDANGNAGESTEFDTMRVLPLATADVVWDQSRGRLYASVPASSQSAYANSVVAINPETLQVTGSSATGQNPGQLALTSGGENLYVSLRGNDTIAKIAPADMTLQSAFPVGSHPEWGPLFAQDIAVGSEPDLVIVARGAKNSSVSAGIAAFDQGVMRPNTVAALNRVERLSDPTLVIGYNNRDTGYELAQLRVDGNGITRTAVAAGLISGFNTDIRADADRVFSTSGVQVNATEMRRMGTFQLRETFPNQPVCPDLARRRVYYLDDAWYGGYELLAFDPDTFHLIRRLRMPSNFTPGVAGIIRFGDDGLALRTPESIVIINTPRLVPNEPPADLSVTIHANPDPVFVGETVSYTVRVTNNGPNTAVDPRVTINPNKVDNVYEFGQAFQSSTCSRGTFVYQGVRSEFAPGDLDVGESAAVVINMVPQSAGRLACSAVVFASTSVDPNVADNKSSVTLQAGFVSAPDSIQRLRLKVDNLLFDPTRGLLWASVGDTIVSIDPRTGLTSARIALGGSAVARSMAIAPNGRYLYVGLTSSAEIHRVDLASPTYEAIRVPLTQPYTMGGAVAQDIEVLEGDGTSFAVTTRDHSAAVYDGVIRRPNRTAAYTVSEIERGAAPDQFVGYNNEAVWPAITGDLTKLAVTAAGISIVQADSNLLRSYHAEIRASGKYLLSSTGQIFNTELMTQTATLANAGTPCIDGPNERAYVLRNYELLAFDLLTGRAAGALRFGVDFSDWGATCVRWGADGFAIRGLDGAVWIARWSSAVPSHIDQDRDLLSDEWELKHFDSLLVKPGDDADGDGIGNAWEYVYGSSPSQASSSVGVHFSVTPAKDGKTMRLQYPRRSGFGVLPYAYEISSDLQTWTETAAVVETVISTEVRDGAPVEIIDAAVTAPAGGVGFLRLRWLGN